MYEQLIGYFYKSVFSLLLGTGIEFWAQSSDYCLQRRDYIHYKIIQNCLLNLFVNVAHTYDCRIY